MPNHIETDEQLLSELRAGVELALSKLMDRYYVPLCKLGDFYLQDRSRAEELVADVFFTIWTKREDLEIHSSFKSYLYVAVKNKALQQLRKSERGQTDRLEDAMEAPSSSPNPLENMILRELNQDIVALVHTLPERRRVIFELNRFESFTYREISELLQISEKTVLNQMGLAIKYLRKYASEVREKQS